MKASNQFGRRFLNVHEIASESNGIEEWLTCSPPPATNCSPASAPARRWAICCAATGSRSAARASLTNNPIKPIRLMGENLVLYKDLAAPSAWSTGIARTAAPTCPTAGSRTAASAAAITAGATTRPAPASSSPTRTPTSPKPSKAGCEIKAYPVREVAGLLWAYMGPQPAPELPVWEPFTWQNGFREIVLADVPCNWFQCQENSIDPGAFRMDARQLVEPHARQRRQRAEASQAQVRGVRARLHLQARARGPERRGPLLDRRPRRAVAERLLPRPPFRMARAGRRREHAVGGVVLRPRAEGPRALRAEQRADLDEARSRARTAAGSPATSSTRTSSPGSGRARSPTAPRRTCARATSASP